MTTFIFKPTTRLDCDFYYDFHHLSGNIYRDSDGNAVVEVSEASLPRFLEYVAKDWNDGSGILQRYELISAHKG